MRLRNVCKQIGEKDFQDFKNKPCIPDVVKIFPKKKVEPRQIHVKSANSILIIVPVNLTVCFSIFNPSHQKLSGFLTSPVLIVSLVNPFYMFYRFLSITSFIIKKDNSLFYLRESAEGWTNFLRFGKQIFLDELSHVFVGWNEKMCSRN